MSIMQGYINISTFDELTYLEQPANFIRNSAEEAKNLGYITYVTKPKLTLLNPMLGVYNFEINDTIRFEWKSANVYNVNIDISKDHGNNWINIAKNLDAKTKNFNWIDKIDITLGNYITRISDSEDSTVNSISFNKFHLDAPLKPPNLILPSNDSILYTNEITLICEEMENVMEYHFQVSRNDNFDDLITNEYDEKNELKVKLDDTTYYYWRVSVTNFSNINFKQFESKFSDIWIFKSGYSKPLKPRLIEPKLDATIDTTQIFVWSTTNNTNYYSFQILSNYDNSIVFDKSIQDTSYKIGNIGLTDNEWYSWKVIANGLGGINESNKSTFTYSIIESIDEEVNYKSGLLFFPNPATSQIYIEYDKPIHQVLIYNLLGMQVWGGEFRDTKAEINVENFAPGVYFLRVRNQVKIFVKE